MLIIQFVIENSPYDLSNDLIYAASIPVALVCLATFIFLESRRHRALLPFRHLFSGRFLTGLFYYCICYLTLSSVNYVLPIFMLQGLAVPVFNAGFILSATGLVALLIAWIHLRLAPTYTKQKYYLVFAFCCLSIFAFMLSQLSPQSTLLQMVIPLLLLNGFTVVGQGASAFNTFRSTDDRIFSQAYQIKNMLRELMNATGVSVANIFLQHREAVHYTRISESLPLDALSRFHVSLTGLLGLVKTQTWVLSCLDYFSLICVSGILLIILSCWQNKIR